MGDHHHHDGEEHHAEEHHDSHGHHHYTPPHYNDLERRLYKRPPGSQNACTDYSIAYESCVREHSGDPLSYIIGVFWGDRLYCAQEKRGYQACELGRAQKAFQRNLTFIKSNRQGEIS